jgi:O-antigen ligase
MNFHINKTWHDNVIERGITGLLVFTPVALAGVPVWASSLMQIAAFILFTVWLHKASKETTITLEAGILLKLFGLFLVLVVVQLLPMPMGLLDILSPGSAAIYRGAGDEAGVSWHPISLYRQATLSELLNLLAYGAVFIVVSNHFRSKEQILSLVRTIVILGCLLVFVAVLQKTTWNGRIYWFYPIDTALQSRISYIWGPYINRNHFAGYLEMAIPLALGLVMYTLSRAGHDQGKTLLRRISALAGHRKLPAFALAVLAVVIMSGALFSTLSRGGILGFAASMAAFIIMMRSRRSLRSKTGVLLLLGLIVAIVGLFAAWDRIEERFMDLADENRIMRTQVWSDLTGMVRDYPVLGTGLGTFDRAFPRYQTRYSTTMFEHAENDYLEVLTDTGLVGFALTIAAGIVFVGTMYRAWKERKNSFATCIGAGGLAACTAIAVHSFTDFNLRIPANALLLTTIAALTVSCLTRVHEQGASTGNFRRRSDRHMALAGDSGLKVQI